MHRGGLVAFLLVVFSPSAGAAGPWRYWFLLEGVPVGTVELQASPGAFTYRSEQLFSRGAGPKALRRQATLAIDAEGRTAGGAVPLGLWLLDRPKQPGCAPVVEELTGRTGEACLARRARGRDAGELLGQPYVAEYDGRGKLRVLTLGQARFERRDGTPRAPPPLLASGLPVAEGEGALRLVPALKTPRPRELRHTQVEAPARAAERVRARRTPEADCWSLSRELQRELGGPEAAAVVLGLVLDGGRAYPHAWVRALGEDAVAREVDPALGIPVTPQTHLRIAEEGQAHFAAGQVYLDLLSGRRRVGRVTRTE